MTMLFGLGMLQTFLANKYWSFQHRGYLSASFFRYLLIYVFAYAINLAAMIELVDRRGYSDRIVQGVMIVVIAGLLFGAQKFWVFRERDARTPERHS
jgi:putative flippase GtrA